ncbi:hypothetical protein [Pelosinus fermentans]|uniref:Uncharacterized protein n=1 Tax=Pelosinus fermentans JBW45 TaxID=1192197 RepID=I9NKH2_9FIRM|nr:hypothetical protein [Pelosinus fermentans]AJQ26306.1 hypothetical protein JBW_00954 [Pelosinus fermentans JBW45]
MCKESFKAVLVCMRCNQETVHDIEYNNKLIVQISCEECGKTIGPYKQITATPLPSNLTHKTTITSSPTPIGNTALANENSRFEKSSKSSSYQSYGELLLSRIITKPSRLNQEIHKDLATFLYSIPVRFMTKPVRIAKEYRTLKDTLHR